MRKVRPCRGLKGNTRNSAVVTRLHGLSGGGPWSDWVSFCRASVAQWIERFRPKEGVGGSIPSGGASASLLGDAFPLSLVTQDSRGEVA